MWRNNVSELASRAVETSHIRPWSDLVVMFDPTTLVSRYLFKLIRPASTTSACKVTQFNGQFTKL